MKALLIAAILCLGASSLVSAACHNFTGSCTKEHFVCANDETVAHSKRCDGVEDCADGTDEYMCDQSSTSYDELPVAERHAVTEVACVKCTCLKGSITVTSTAGTWWTIAKKAPRDFKMMTDSPSQQNRPCAEGATNFATSIVLNVYKKQNKGCRGWVCCLRQESCSVCSGTGNTASHCY